MSAHRYATPADPGRDVREFADRVRGECGLSDFWLSFRPGSGCVVLQRVETAPEARGQGRADRALAMLCEFADDRGYALALTPSGDFGASRPRLEGWYRRYGFSPNRGRRRDFSTRETMVRLPRKN